MTQKKKIKAIQFGHNADVIYEIDTGSSTTNWGEIKGNIDNQTDLKTKLDSKAETSTVESALSLKADKTELDNLATKTELNGKQDALNEAQLNAVNSGVTSNTVITLAQHTASSFLHVTGDERKTWNKVTNKADTSALDTEVTNRTNGDTNTLNSAKTYTDIKSNETLDTAKEYTDSKVIDADEYFDSIMPIGIIIGGVTPKRGIWKLKSSESSYNVYERVWSLGTTVYDNTTTEHLDIDLTGQEDFSFEGAGEDNMAVEGDLYFLMSSMKENYLGEAFVDNGGVTSVTFPNLTTTSNSCCYGTFRNCSSIESAKFPQLTTVGPYGLIDMFSGSSIQSVSFPKLTTIEEGGLGQLLMNSSMSGDIELPELTTVGVSGMANFLENCHINKLSFPKLTTLENGAFSCGLKKGYVNTISFPHLENVATNGFDSAFYQINGLQTVMFRELNTCGDYSFFDGFNSSPSIVSVDFPLLLSVGNDSFRSCFYNCESLSTVSFGSLETIGTTAFINAFANCPNLEGVHFPFALSGNDELTAEKLGCDKSKIFFDL